MRLARICLKFVVGAIAMKDEKIISAYEEIGKNYRFFLNWRNALFGGHITVVAAHVVAFSWIISQGLNNPLYYILISLSGLFITLIFWALEYRTRKLYHFCTTAGREWEKANVGGLGVYTKLDPGDKQPQNVLDPLLACINHSNTLDAYFKAVLAVFLILILDACIYPFLFVLFSK